MRKCWETQHFLRQLKDRNKKVLGKMLGKEVKICETAIAKEPGILTASAVGSCVVITLYHPRRKIGAMAHAMLPNRQSLCVGCESPNKSRDTKHVDEAIDEILRMMKTQGAKAEDLEAKIVGGANMFPGCGADIGRDSVLSAKEKLKKEGIKVVGESVGGSIGRSVEFSVASGIMTVKIKF